MIFDVITLFPQMFDALTQYGITRRAAEQGNYILKTWNPRDFTTDNYLPLMIAPMAVVQEW